MLKICDVLHQKMSTLKINLQDAFSFRFFSKDYYSRRNLIVLIGLVGGSATKFALISKLYDMPNKILLTITKKKDQLCSIDLVKYFLSLMLKEDEFTKKLSDSA